MALQEFTREVPGSNLGKVISLFHRDKVNDVDGFVVCIILIYSHNGQPIYIGQVTLIRV